MPGNSNPAALYLFNHVITQFEQAYHNEKIVGKNDPYDPTTYLAKIAAGQAEDATDSYFTEPPLLIKKHAVADITSLAKGWQGFSSYNPSIASLVTDPTTGKIYGIPQNGYALSLFYNRKLFKAAGLDPDKPPTTWDEFRSYAKQLTGAGVFGYAETSTQNQGGWHFTNWMYTAGGDMQSTDGTKVLFNSDKGVSILQLLKEMRFTDQSLTKQQLYTQDDTLQLLATGKVAMVVMAPSQLGVLKTQYQANLDDFGIGPMPQNGGNSALTGGSVFIFNPKASQATIKAAFDYVIYSNFNLEILESQLANQSSSGQVVGAPTNVLFIGDLQNKLNVLNAKYANVPVQNYIPFTSAKLSLRPEPRNQTQKLYAALDSVMQAVLTNPRADPPSLLNQTAHQFQQELDQAL